MGLADTRIEARRTFTDSEVAAILDKGPRPTHVLTDRCALRLLLQYGLRKSALRGVRLEHFDWERKRLYIFTKNSKVQTIPIPDPGFWGELSGEAGSAETRPSPWLLCKQRPVFGRLVDYPDQPMSSSALHRWWHDCLDRAGVPHRRMHSARHTAIQKVLDVTGGNLKAAQKLAGHASIQTTANVYVDWDIDQLEETMRSVVS